MHTLQTPFHLSSLEVFTIQTVEVPSSASFGESLRTSLSQTEKSKGQKSALPCTHGSVLRH